MDIRTERATQPVELTDAELDHVHGGTKKELGNGMFKVDDNKIIKPGKGPVNF